jgi:ATP-binding cassette subfamily B multidrug efflux pump
MQKHRHASLWRHLGKYRLYCVIAPLFMVGEISVDLIQPDLMAQIIDDGVTQGNLSLVISIGIRMILLVLAGGACGILCGVFANIGSQRFGNDVRKDLFSHIQDLSFEQTDSFSTGSLITRLCSDVTQIQNLVMTMMRGLIRSGLMFAGGIFMLYHESHRFAIVALCALPFVIAAILFFLYKASPIYTVVQDKLDGVNNAVQENLAGVRVVRAFVQEDAEQERFDKVNKDLCDTTLKVNEMLAFLTPFVNIVLNLAVVTVLYLAGGEVLAGSSLASGQVIASITYMTMILNAVTFLANVFQNLTRAIASVRRVGEVLDTEPVIRDGKLPAQRDGSLPAQKDGSHPPMEAADSTSGSIEFDHVSFTYPGTTSPVLSDLTFSLTKGQTLGIIGATGCGKTSLIQLVPRFYDVTEGRVLVDGVDVRDYRLSDLRSKIAYVSQKAELYSGSIRDNITFGREEITDEKIREAAKIAQADGFILEQKEGYDTPVTESGHSLSGGQKQRISIARALAGQSEILVLDDATSALDLETESELYGTLRAQRPFLTRIIVAQRIHSIEDADQILVLDHGKVVGLGTHDELKKSCTVYRDLCRLQLGEEAL